MQSIAQEHWQPHPPARPEHDVRRVQIAACSVHKSGALLLEDREGQFWDENLVRVCSAEPPLQQQCALGELLVSQAPCNPLVLICSIRDCGQA